MNIFKRKYLEYSIRKVKEKENSNLEYGLNILRGMDLDYDQTYALYKEELVRSKQVLQDELPSILLAKGNMNDLLEVEHFIYCWDFLDQLDLLEKIISSVEVKSRISRSLVIRDIPKDGGWKCLHE